MSNFEFFKLPFDVRENIVKCLRGTAGLSKLLEAVGLAHERGAYLVPIGRSDCLCGRYRREVMEDEGITMLFEDADRPTVIVVVTSIPHPLSS